MKANQRMRLLNKGFTLWELMLAFAILLMVLSSLLLAFINFTFLNESNNNLVVAVNDAQHVLEQIKGLDYASIDGYTPPPFNNLNNEDVPNPMVIEISEGLKKVTVNVSWTERQRNRDFSLSTLIAR